MSKDNVVSLQTPEADSDPLTDLIRENSKSLVEAAAAAEFEAYLSAINGKLLPDGRRRVERNGDLPERKILTGVEAVGVSAPKSRGRSDKVELFHSSLAPRYVHRCTSLDAAIP